MQTVERLFCGPSASWALSRYQAGESQEIVPSDPLAPFDPDSLAHELHHDHKSSSGSANSPIYPNSASKGDETVLSKPNERQSPFPTCTSTGSDTVPSVSSPSQTLNAAVSPTSSSSHGEWSTFVAPSTSDLQDSPLAKTLPLDLARQTAIL